MANSYNAQVGVPGNNSPFGSTRSLAIITDTLQSAMAIARTKCTGQEQVLSVTINDYDVIIDFTVVKSDGCN